MQSENAIVVKNVSKKFRVYLDKGSTLKEKMLFKKRRKYESRTVLDNISFEVKKGEAVGLVGQNGCGKSTTLKLLTKIMYPDSGTIQMTGRVSSLLELGAGFHPDMSGRQNIYTNASIFGLTRKEIDARLNSIIEFSELEAFIDNPIRTYSSGMYMRLAFSVAINVDADILLIDEILAVGDANFQAKCFDKLRELKATGITIVLVTHDVGTIERFCNRSIWLDHGKICEIGSSAAVIDTYLKYMNHQKLERLEEKKPNTNIDKPQSPQSESSSTASEAENESSPLNTDVSQIDYTSNHFGLGYVVIEKAIIRNQHGKQTYVLTGNAPCSIEICFKVNKPLDEYVFGIGIYTLDGVCLIGSNTQLDRLRITDSKVNGMVRFRINSLSLLTGKYMLNVAIVDNNGTPMDYYRDYCHFDVITEDRSVGFLHLEHCWEIG